MRKTNLIISIFLVSLLLFLLSTPVVMSAESKDMLFKEAQLLYKTDSQYVDARFKNQWKAIYSFQHPGYQKAISVEEFQYFGGHVVANYREDKTFQRNISGFPIYPSVEDIKRNPIKKDPFLGVPLPPEYRFIPNPLFNVTGHKFEKVYINNSGTLGKVAFRLKIIETFPPSVMAGELKIKRDILFVDYWEKVNGKWVVPFMKPFFGHLSGASTKLMEHPFPTDMTRWNTAHFTEFKPEDLK